MFLGPRVSTYDRSLEPFRVENHVFLKDYVNDTLYVLENHHMEPAYIFGLGEYSYPIDYLETFDTRNPFPLNSFIFGTGLGIVGTPEFFFYKIRVPDSFSRPKTKLRYNHLLNEFRPDDSDVYGIYHIEQKTSRHIKNLKRY